MRARSITWRSVTPESNREKAKPPSAETFSDPAALLDGRQQVKALCDSAAVAAARSASSKHGRIERSDNRRLFDHGKRSDLSHHRPHRLLRLAGTLNQPTQLGPGDLRAVGKLENRLVETGGDEVRLQRTVVLEVNLGVAAL